MAGFHVGTSGWSYPHWLGVLYPEGTRSSEFLEVYVQRFDCVELNASFYRLPKEATVRGWLRRTPEGFRFCLKMSRLVTHLKRLAEVEGRPLANFFQRFEPLRPRLGPVLVQLPPSLAFEAGRVQAFFALLRERHAEHRYALEARHKSWFEETALDLLEQYGVALVIADSGGRFPSAETVTADFVYLRFHGPADLYRSNYPDEMLADYARKVRDWLAQGLEVWAFFNNDVGGHAVRNALRLREMVGVGTADSAEGR